MKFPFISRSRHETESARLKEKIEKAEAKQTRLAQKMASATTRYNREFQRATGLEQLCEQRIREIEHLQSAMEELRLSRKRLLDELGAARRAMTPYEGRAVPIILGFDIEPDDRVVDLKNPSWHSTIELFARVDHLRRTLSAAAGGAPVRFTWFPRADPQVEKANGSSTWALTHFRKQWQTLTDAGDEIGLHMHPWKWDAETEEWCQDHADEAWVAACTRSSLAAFRQVFGSAPGCYRGGDRYLSNDVVRILEEEGVRVDLTLERMPEVPKLVPAERGTGVIPDGTSIPVRAYTPSSADFRVPGHSTKTGLGILPLTSYEGGALSPWISNVVFEEALGHLLERVATNAPDAPTHLAFVARANIVMLPEWEDFTENLRSLARRVWEGRAFFATGSETWAVVAPR